jgi:branched-chain amino acid transport system ATP-binding protein
MLLSTHGLDASYGGGVNALSGIEIHIAEGEMVCLLGANGAGKTTLVNVISGLVPVRSGDLVFQGTSIRGWRADKRVALGIALCPEGRKLFPQMTVLENMRLGAYLVRDHGRIGESAGHCFDLFPILREKRHDPAGTLSGGQQQMLAVSRALMSQPRLLILDEPSLGLSPMLVQEIYRVIAGIAAAGTTVLLVEQNASVALEHCGRGYVLETGQIVLEGTRDELRSNEKVIKAYLGG